MSKVDQSLSKIFDVEPLYPRDSDITPMIPDDSQMVPLEADDSAVVPMEDRSAAVVELQADDEAQMDQDIERVRQNLHSLIHEGQEAFKDLIHIAKAEEKVSAFEVSNAYLGTLTAMNMQLIQLHEKRRKLKQAAKEDAPAGGVVINGGTANIAFVGTTKELMEHRKRQKQSGVPPIES